MSQDVLIAFLAIFGFAVVFPLLWIFIGLLLGLVGGWRGLSKRFPTEAPAPARMQTGVSGRMGWVNYNHVLKVGIEPDALYLSVNVLFRVASDPLGPGAQRRARLLALQALRRAAPGAAPGAPGSAGERAGGLPAVD